MKKFISLLLPVIIILSFVTSCSFKDSSDNDILPENDIITPENGETKQNTGNTSTKEASVSNGYSTPPAYGASVAGGISGGIGNVSGAATEPAVPTTPAQSTPPNQTTTPPAKTTTPASNNTSGIAHGISYAGEYAEIFALIKENHSRSYYMYDDDVDFADEMEDSAAIMPSAPVVNSPGNASPDRTVPETAAMEEAVKEADSSDMNSDYSETNNQIEGIQEGDIVKSDGKNIYIASHFNNSVSAVKTDNGKMQKIAQFKKENASPVELLLYNQKLIIIWSKQTYTQADYSRGYYNYRYENETIVEIYSINGGSPELVSSYAQEGWYKSSRMIDNIIYLITDYAPYITAELDEKDYWDYVPVYAVNGVEKPVPAGCIVIPEKLDYTQYTVIGGIDVNKANPFVSVQANLGGSNIIYSSFDNIYVTSYSYEVEDDYYYQEYTVINKFSINKGQVAFIAAGKVMGNVQTQFYMDEYKGILRVVTQVWGNGRSRGWGSQGGSLYTLDGNMKLLCETHGIGGNEMVQSVRFDNHIAYIVTFRQTDPLFSFDLSNPMNHVKLGELKIPGFSRYLHKWNDGLLLGVGVDADETTGRRTGLKLSMFDVSDNENLSERHVYIISGKGRNEWYNSIAEHEHKSILVSPDKNIIAFPYTYEYRVYTENQWNDYWNSGSAYAIFSYDKEKGFTLIGEIKIEDRDYNYSSYFQRGLYIGDYIYAVAENKIVSARISNFEVIETFAL